MSPVPAPNHWLACAAVSARIAASPGVHGPAQVHSLPLRAYSPFTAWEPAFEKLVSGLRDQEAKKILHANMLRAANAAIHFLTTPFCTFAAMACHFWLGHTITLRKVFVCLSLFNCFMFYVSLMFVSAIEACSEGLISLQRMRDFLLLEERPAEAAAMHMPSRART